MNPLGAAANHGMRAGKSAAVAQAAVSGHDTPAGFWYGTDSSHINIPGPHYNGTASEAYAWGEAQAARTISDIADVHVKYPVAVADIEIPGNAPNYTPAPDNGWNTVYTSPCSGVVKSRGIPTSVDRAV